MSSTSSLSAPDQILRAQKPAFARQPLARPALTPAGTAEAAPFRLPDADRVSDERNSDVRPARDNKSRDPGRAQQALSDTRYATRLSREKNLAISAAMSAAENSAANRDAATSSASHAGTAEAQAGSGKLNADKDTISKTGAKDRLEQDTVATATDAAPRPQSLEAVSVSDRALDASLDVALLKDGLSERPTVENAPDAQVDTTQLNLALADPAASLAQAALVQSTPGIISEVVSSIPADGTSVSGVTAATGGAAKLALEAAALQVQEAGLADKSGQISGSVAVSKADADAKSQAEKLASAGSENSVQSKTETKGIPSQEGAIPVEATVRNPVRSAPEKTDAKAGDLAAAKPDSVAFSPVPPAASLAAQTTAPLVAGDFLRAETVPETRPTMIHAVPMEIGFRALQGQKRFDIRLDPGDLGRVDVRLDISDDGSVKALLTVDRVETLQLLQRDARSLEQAFEQAGLKSSDSSVDIQLRDRNLDPGQSHNRSQQDDTPQKVIRTAIVDEDAPLALHPSLVRTGRVSTRGVDIVI